MQNLSYLSYWFFLHPPGKFKIYNVTVDPVISCTIPAQRTCALSIGLNFAALSL